MKNHEVVKNWMSGTMRTGHNKSGFFRFTDDTIYSWNRPLGYKSHGYVFLYDSENASIESKRHVRELREVVDPFIIILCSRPDPSVEYRAKRIYEDLCTNAVIYYQKQKRAKNKLKNRDRIRDILRSLDNLQNWIQHLNNQPILNFRTEYILKLQEEFEKIK